MKGKATGKAKQVQDAEHQEAAKGSRCRASRGSKGVHSVERHDAETISRCKTLPGRERFTVQNVTRQRGVDDAR